MGPFNNRDKASLDKAIFTLQQAVPDIEAAKRAGIDVSEYELRHNDAYNRLMKIRVEYFGSQLPKQ